MHVGMYVCLCVTVGVCICVLVYVCVCLSPCVYLFGLCNLQKLIFLLWKWSLSSEAIHTNFIDMYNVYRKRQWLHSKAFNNTASKFEGKKVKVKAKVSLMMFYFKSVLHFFKALLSVHLSVQIAFYSYYNCMYSVCLSIMLRNQSFSGSVWNLILKNKCLSSMYGSKFESFLLN